MRSAVAIVLLAIAVFAQGEGVGAAQLNLATHLRAQQRSSCDVVTPLIWLKVDRTSCSTGKTTSLRMRSYIRDHPGGADENGVFHHRVGDWRCHASYVGSDEVLSRCRQPVPHSSSIRKISAMFYAASA